MRPGLHQSQELMAAEAAILGQRLDLGIGKTGKHVAFGGVFETLGEPGEDLLHGVADRIGDRECHEALL